MFQALEPRIGVFVCNCGTNIGGVVSVPSVVNYASTLPHVVHVEQNLFTCAQDTQDRMKSLDPGAPSEPGRGGRLFPENP